MGRSKPTEIAALSEFIADPAKPRREQAIDAAAHVFARFGYHGAGTRMIAEMLGIKAASLYSFFRSKDFALEEVCRVGIQQPIVHLRDACASHAGFEARIRHFMRANTQALGNTSDYVVVYMNERRYLTQEGTRRLNALARELRTDFDCLFADARAEGRLRPDLSFRMARLILIGVLRNVTQFYVEGPIADFDNFVEISADHFLRGVMPIAPSASIE